MKTVIGFTLLGILSLAVACDEPTDPGTPPGADGGSVTLDGGSTPVTCPAPTSGPTHHEGDLPGDEVWTADASPHLVDWDVSVADGHKLTIEPCATVLVAKGKHIWVAYPGVTTGSLVAEGTAEKPIRIAGQTGEPWASIYLHAPGTARLAHVTLEGGGGGDFEDHSTLDMIGDGVLPADPVLSLDHVTVKGSVGAGVYMQRGATFIAGSKDLTITASGNDDFPFPVQIEEHAMDALPTGTYTGNKIDEILLRTEGYGVAGGGLVVDATLHERGVPYRMGRLDGLDNFIVGPSDDRPAATMTIEPGVVMRFAQHNALKIQASSNDEPARGAIRALGTADKPIVFTSAEANPHPGDWRGLWFGGNAMPTNALDHVRIEYAGSDCSCSLNTCSAITESEGAVIFTGQAPGAFITNSVFKGIAAHGITEGYDGSFVNFRPTNLFEDVAGCVQTLPRPPSTICPIKPLPACDGL